MSSYQKWQHPVANASKQVHHRLPLAVELGHPQLLRDVADTEHGPGDVEVVGDAILSPGHPGLFTP